MRIHPAFLNHSNISKDMGVTRAEHVHLIFMPLFIISLQILIALLLSKVKASSLKKIYSIFGKRFVTASISSTIFSGERVRHLFQ